MTKAKETIKYVYYNFETDVPGEPVLDKRGKLRPSLITKIGIFKYDKNENDIALIPDKTDEYFFNNKRTKFFCWARMNDCRIKNEYPNIIIHT